MPVAAHTDQLAESVAAEPETVTIVETTGHTGSGVAVTTAQLDVIGKVAVASR